MKNSRNARSAESSPRLLGVGVRVRDGEAVGESRAEERQICARRPSTCRRPLRTFWPS